MKNRISPILEQAHEILHEVEGKNLSVKERKKYATELASLILKQANRTITFAEKREQKKLAAMMKDPLGKPFTVAFTDECFRSSRSFRVADQICFLLDLYGIPSFLPSFQKFGLFLFKIFGKPLAPFMVPILVYMLRRQAVKVILPGEEAPLIKHIQKRQKEDVRLNINHLGEAILSEEEALRRLKIYLDDMTNPYIDYVSIKISTIYSQINFIGIEESKKAIKERLKRLYRAAKDNAISDKDGNKRAKFINLDMEEYRDLHLTVDVFKEVLSEEEFFDLSAGIVLQAYIPDSFVIQKELTSWAQNRRAKGGAPIKIRIVKGANLAMEQVEASVYVWPQTPYTSKLEVDANYKRMVEYALTKEHAEAARVGIASHNVFDLAYALILRKERGLQEYSEIEMLEGMADHIRRVIQELTGEVLLYCPVARKEDFRYAFAYLVRRLDENTGADNFLRHLFGLKPGSPAWDSQVALFKQSCEEIDQVSKEPRRTQNQNDPETSGFQGGFQNEPNSDFSLPQNQVWAKDIIDSYKTRSFGPIPNQIGGTIVQENQSGSSVNPSHPEKPFFSYMLSDQNHVKAALECAKSYEKKWQEIPFDEKEKIFIKAAELFRAKRKSLLGVMMVDGGKVLTESDPEISEAIDFIEYYRKMVHRMKRHQDLTISPKGTVLVTPPWNFPAAIPVGGMVAALMTGNCVIFKPAPEAILVGWHLAEILWEAGVPKEALQFLTCNDDPEGSMLITDKRVNLVVLTGATSTAKLFIDKRPSLDLSAETGGKNSMIITAMADRDLAIKDLVHSAFGHGGQKCSAASIAILEKELYDDPHFLRQLREAVSSLKVGPADLPDTKLAPLIRPPSDPLLQGLTTLEPGESWLLEPKVDPSNPHLWSPAIRLGVKEGSFTHMTELFGPHLSIMRAENLHDAIQLVNSVPYGLTSGLHSLDEREQNLWVQSIEAGNLYINRTMTGAIVRRQPFGGCKQSSFGKSFKAGGPNYLCNFTHISQNALPKEKQPVNIKVNDLTKLISAYDLSTEELGNWYATIANYSFWWKKIRQKRDPSKLIGQDNYFFYRPVKNLFLRVTGDENPIDILKICAAVLTCGAKMEISFSEKVAIEKWSDLSSQFICQQETITKLHTRLKQANIEKIRMAIPPDEAMVKAAAENYISIVSDPVLSNGRFELIHYLREVSLSIDYHRYGNLGIREGELRSPVK
jgi:RHH-type transcriptional regulator, proline utilization regulon repressor / proline dehydrogenase / delta 1-pyrroline-5-carboxylate dehydrogenase